METKEEKKFTLKALFSIDNGEMGFLKLTNRGRKVLESYALLNYIAECNECSISDVMIALESNVVRQELSQQIKYNKTGELPK